MFSQRMQCQKEEVDVWGRGGHFRELRHKHSSWLAHSKQLPSAVCTAGQPCTSAALPAASDLDFATALLCSDPAWDRELLHGGRGSSEETSGDWRQVWNMQKKGAKSANYVTACLSWIRLAQYVKCHEIILLWFGAELIKLTWLQTDTLGPKMLPPVSHPRICRLQVKQAWKENIYIYIYI